MRATSLATRASWAAFASAGLAAATAAAASSVFADALVLRATDRRLEAAAGELVHEVDAAPPESLAALVAEEQEEANVSGVRLALYGSDGVVTGDRNVPAVTACTSMAGHRVCSVAGRRGTAVASLPHATPVALLVLAAAAAATFAGAVAWLLARVLSRRAVAPLLRLRERIAGLPLVPAVDLGADDGVLEVDELRATIRLALARMQDSVERSSRFAANAAHELRTPLTTLRAELELLAEKPDAGADAAITTALRKVNQLQTLTERLLVLATPEENTESFELVSLRDVVDDVLADLPEADRARVEANGDEDAFVRGDAAALRSVVTNGLSNALKLASRVDVELSRDGDTAVLAIDDDGPGVSEEHRARMFEPFARIPGNRAPGHGLGLALVAHVARWHAGEARLLASRRHPQGARLEVRFPVSSSG
ncbi:MAG: HAMP domain-containing histidine kinase [Labilithrix sp.]|nr:HAMP domain-containing histidine kinase [Labilithrix sp.]MCW5817421.1 HAMP domain-containing histidine kinase [Labilithrix sp.]